MLTLVAWFAVLVGLGMIGQWAVSLGSRQVPELRTEPVRIAFHLVGEFATAAALITAGAGLILDAGWAPEVALVAMGMLLYTAIVSPGYFGQKGQWRMVAMFAVLVALALASCWVLASRG